MNIFRITSPDIENGEGFRASLWLSGCPIKCVGCHNQQLWDGTLGEMLVVSDVIEQLRPTMQKPYIQGISVLGGEPLVGRSDGELQVLSALLSVFRAEFPDKDIWLYTGGDLCDLLEKPGAETIFLYRSIISMCDVLVSGPFILAERDRALAFRGSANQKIWRVKVDGLVDVSADYDSNFLADVNNITK